MHIITPYNPWAPKKKKTWQEQLWEEQTIAEAEARMLAEVQSRTMPENAPDTSLATVGPAANAAAGGGGVPVFEYFKSSDVVNFLGNPLTGAGPLTVVFRNLTPTPQFDTYLWNFGDGVTSTAVHPVHVFQSGSDALSDYTVSLTVTARDSSTRTETKNGYISASKPVVTAAFTFTTSSTVFPVVAPVIANFTNTSTNTSQTPTTNYSWIIVNGFDGVFNTYGYTTTNVTNLTLHSGSVTASLVATGSYGATSTATSRFYLSAPSLTARYTFTTSSNSAPSVTTFLNTLNGSGTQYDGSGTLTYFWELGSGSLTASSAIPNPTTYTVAGPYTASLAVTESSYNIMSYYTQSWYIA